MQGTSATTHVSAVDTPDGVALVFTTTRYVDDLRARVREMAATHGEMAASHAAIPASDGAPHMKIVPAASVVEDVPGGARIVFASSDPARVSTLREHAHKQAQLMEEGRCPGMAQPPPPLNPEVKDELEMMEG